MKDAMLQLVDEIIGECEAAGWPIGDCVVDRRVPDIRANAYALRGLLEGLHARVSALEASVKTLEETKT